MRHWARRLGQALLGLVILIAAWAVGASVFGHFEDRFEITREIHIESGKHPSARAVATTGDGGFVVAGSYGYNSPWATRVNAQGDVRWRHEIPFDEPSLPVRTAEYFGAATLNDDSTLLCGHKEINKPKDPPVSPGLLTHVSNNGAVLYQRLIYPNDDESFHLNYFTTCIHSRTGAIVIGHTHRATGTTVPRKVENFLWILAIDVDGNIDWQRLIPAEPSVGDMAGIGLPNGDIVAVWHDGGGTKTELVRVTSSGDVAMHRTVPGYAFIVEPVGERVSKVDLISVKGDAGTIVSAEDRRTEDSVVKIGAFFPKRVFRAADGSLILAGYSRAFGEVAAIQRITASGSSELRFKPLHASYWIEDAVPTGANSEFVTIRRVSVPGAARNARNGATLTVVRLRKGTAWDVIREKTEAVMDVVVTIATHPKETLIFLASYLVNAISKGH